jgi:hypothetical protein
LQAGEECEPGISEVPCDEFCKIITEKKPVAQDLCGTADGGKDLTDPGVSFDIVRAPQVSMEQSQAEKGITNTYTCDEVCAARGQKCIGVGLTNVATNRCVSVKHHNKNMCELSENLNQGSGCSDRYRIFVGGTCLEISSPCKSGWEPCGVYSSSDILRGTVFGDVGVDADAGAVEGQSYVQFSVGETACYCQ